MLQVGTGWDWGGEYWSQFYHHGEAWRINNVTGRIRIGEDENVMYWETVQDKVEHTEFFKAWLNCGGRYTTININPDFSRPCDRYVFAMEKLDLLLETIEENEPLELAMAAEDIQTVNCVSPEQLNEQAYQNDRIAQEVLFSIDQIVQSPSVSHDTQYGTLASGESSSDETFPSLKKCSISEVAVQDKQLLITSPVIHTHTLNCKCTARRKCWACKFGEDDEEIELRQQQQDRQKIKQQQTEINSAIRWQARVLLRGLRLANSTKLRFRIYTAYTDVCIRLIICEPQLL
jgi:hypothetical protein